MDSSGDLLARRYYAAVEAKKERTSKHAQSFGARPGAHSSTSSQSLTGANKECDWYLQTEAWCASRILEVDYFQQLL
ncbi:hypothetical protein EOD39_7092 [Acipenser ruthenus]|uniref:Uncharacterized protein n=1 Tax=Acipenser ruthenus TaxID=7906 RepID=A0A444U8H2_ACIRT|nr:hypothetical protein EOD39_7092 [Acipenser ruthenus]